MAFSPLVVLSGLWSGLVVSSLGLDNINRSEVMFILLIHLCAHASSSERWTVSEGEEDKVSAFFLNCLLSVERGKKTEVMYHQTQISSSCHLITGNVFKEIHF